MNMHNANFWLNANYSFPSTFYFKHLKISNIATYSLPKNKKKRKKKQIMTRKVLFFLPLANYMIKVLSTAPKLTF